MSGIPDVASDDVMGMQASTHRRPAGSEDEPACPDGWDRNVVQCSETIAAARRGEAWAFDRLFSELGSPLQAFVRSRGADDPEGMVNDVLVQLFAALPTFVGDESGLRGLAFAIARRRLVDEFRHAARRPRLELRGEIGDLARPAPDAAVVAEQAAGVERARLLLDQLTDDQRDALLLRFVAGLTIAETAAALDKPVSAVKALQRRGVASLRRLLDPHDLDPTGPTAGSNP